MQNNKSEQIQDYLYYGYVPYKNEYHWILTESQLFDIKLEYTPICAAKVFDKVFESILKSISFEKINFIIPISGGWDSRIILGAAMERFDHKKIKTVSYGIPGQLDYDIGCKIAERFGLDHHAVDLSKIELNWDDLLKSVKDSPWTYVPDGYFNRLAVSQVTQSSEDVVLSGFLGEALTGGHLLWGTRNQESIDVFVKKQRREKNIWLASPDYNPKRALGNIVGQEGIGYGDLLDLGIRQANCIAPIVTPQKRWQGWGGDMGLMNNTGARVLAPFSQKQWAAYWLTVPEELKRNQVLYLQMMKYKFPELAAMPSKYSLGVMPDKKYSYIISQLRHKFNMGLKYLTNGFYNYTEPHLNYLNFADAFRNRNDYKDVLDKAFTFLKKRKYIPWLNIEVLIKDHMLGRSSYENALLILIGLALNLYIEEV